MTYAATQFEITSSLNCDGRKVWGFRLESGRKQSPCWPTQREAVESAKFYINLERRGR